MQEYHFLHWLTILFMTMATWEGHACRQMIVVQAKGDGGSKDPKSVIHCAGQGRWGKATPDID